MQQLFLKYRYARSTRVIRFALLLGMALASPAHAQLVFDTPSVDFGKIALGSSSPTITVNMRNTGSQTLTVSCAGGAPSSAQFYSSQGCQGKTLDPGETCPYNFSFTPDSVGLFNAGSNPFCNGASLSVDLQGEGQLPALVVDTPAVDFGTVNVGVTSPTVSVNMRNQGPDPVTVSCAGGGASPSQFAGAQSCQGKVLSAGGTCTWIYQFTPDQPGEVTGASNFYCNGVSLGVTLRGEGKDPLAIFSDSFE